MYEPYGLNDIVVRCPYNVNHRISRSRLQKHIIKCEKNYFDNDKIICPYNATHRLLKSEIANHITTCPMRQLIEPELYLPKTTRHKSQLEISTIDCNEDWDAESDIDDMHDVDNNFEVNEKSDKLNSDDTDIRAPHSFSEAMLRDENEELKMDDMESVASFMGIGRGKVNPNKIHLFKRIGLGRGKA